jgi:hypothetical protein
LLSVLLLSQDGLHFFARQIRPALKPREKRITILLALYLIRCRNRASAQAH